MRQLVGVGAGRQPQRDRVDGRAVLLLAIGHELEAVDARDVGAAGHAQVAAVLGARLEHDGAGEEQPLARR